MFSAIPVASDAVIQIIHPFVFFLHLGSGMFVAFITGVSRVIIGIMTIVADSFGSPMCDRKSMINIGRFPTGGAVAN
jgi:heme/copper-type cytochrome/quinol oxidase subunit 4